MDPEQTALKGPYCLLKKASKIFQQTTKNKRFFAVIGNLSIKRLRG